MKLYNTLTRQVEQFSPLNPDQVTIYACGPTVYDYAHIGHMRKYTNDDLLKRVLIANGYLVKHVMNITDVGHLVSDADEGEDKFEKGARERQMTVWEVAKFFEKDFRESIKKMNITPSDVSPRATEHIEAQIKLIETLEKKGFTYQTDEAVYFDVSKFPTYTQLNRQSLEDKEVGVRDEVRTDSHKKHPADFALWFFTVGHFADHVMRWPSPWGEGFPGWHIECSAMSMEYLGPTIDIHTGGIDHISVHHTNEIAQSEAATDQKFVNYWVHHNFMQVEGEKMSKSLKNGFRLSEIEERGFDPMALRYLFLTAHYRDQQNFTWESLQSAQNALNKLRETIRDWPLNDPLNGIDKSSEGYYNLFLQFSSNDLKLPQALAVMWVMINNTEFSSASKIKPLLKMDQIMGLNLDNYLGKQIEIPIEVQKLLDQREGARNNKDFSESDRLRDEIKKLGFEIDDTPSGQKVHLS